VTAQINVGGAQSQQGKAFGPSFTDAGWAELKPTLSVTVSGATLASLNINANKDGCFLIDDATLVLEK
jgi:hypothetical protein